MSPLLSATARLRSEKLLPHHGATSPLGATDPFIPYRSDNSEYEFGQMAALPRTMPGTGGRSNRRGEREILSSDWYMSFLGDIQVDYSAYSSMTIRQDHVHGGVILPQNMPDGWAMPGGLKGFWIMEPLSNGFPLGYSRYRPEVSIPVHSTSISFDVGRVPKWVFWSKNVFPYRRNVGVKSRETWRLTYWVQFAHPDNVVGHIVPYDLRLAGTETVYRTSFVQTSPALLVDRGQPVRVEEVEDPQLPLHNLFLEKIHHWQLYGYQMEIGWDYHATNIESRDGNYGITWYNDLELASFEVKVDWQGEFRVRS